MGYASFTQKQQWIEKKGRRDKIKRIAAFALSLGERVGWPRSDEKWGATLGGGGREGVGRD